GATVSEPVPDRLVIGNKLDCGAAVSDRSPAVKNLIKPDPIGLIPLAHSSTPVPEGALSVMHLVVELPAERPFEAGKQGQIGLSREFLRAARLLRFCVTRYQA